MLICLYRKEWYYIQRHAFHNALREKALQEEIVLHTGCKISNIDVNDGRVTLEDGRRFHGDVLLGADGIHVKVIAIAD